MMKKKIKKVILTICLYALGFIFCGCTQEEDILLLTEEGMMQSVGAVEDDIISDVEDGHELDVSPASDVEKRDTTIVVYLCGAVNTPGIVTLPEGSRINDAILAAGGFREDAVVTSVNLAAKLSDEEMIYVASKEDEFEKAMNTASKEDKLININTADIGMLCDLPGIGENKARDIILYREKNGAFQKKEDIMRVDGIKENLYNKIEEMISVK